MKDNKNFNLDQAIEYLTKLSALTSAGSAVPVGKDKRPITSWKKDNNGNGKGSYLNTEEAIEIAKQNPTTVAGFGLVLNEELLDIDKDIDPQHPLAHKLSKVLDLFFGDVAYCVWGRTTDPYRHILLKVKGLKKNQFKPIAFPTWLDNEGNAKDAKIEFRNGDRYVIIPPALYGDDDQYTWHRLDWLEKGIGNLPKVEVEKRYRLLKLVSLLVPFYNDGYRQNLCLHLSGWLDRLGYTHEDIEKVIQALETLNPGKDTVEHRLDVLKYLEGKDKITGFPSLVEEVLKPQGATEKDIEEIYQLFEGATKSRKTETKKAKEQQPQAEFYTYRRTSPVIQAINQRIEELGQLVDDNILELIDKLDKEEFDRYPILPYNLLLSGGVKYVVGAPKTGKSLFSVQLALSLAEASYKQSKVDVLGGEFNLPKPVKVLYLALDERQDILRNKFIKLTDKETLRTLIAKGWLQIKTSFKFIRTYQDLLDFEQLVEGYDVVFIDMVSSLFEGENLEILEATSQFLVYLERLSDKLDRTVTFFCLDHTAKRNFPTSDAMDLIRGGAWMSGKVTDILILYHKRNSLHLRILGRTTPKDLDLKLSVAENGEMVISEKSLEDQLGKKEVFVEVSKRGRTLEVLFKYFLDNKNKFATLSDIVEATGLNKNNVKVTIHRHAQYFEKHQTSKYSVYYRIKPEYFEKTLKDQAHYINTIFSPAYGTDGKEKEGPHQKEQKTTNQLGDNEVKVDSTNYNGYGPSEDFEDSPDTGFIDPGDLEF